jgi:phosphatidylserine/phosphatidylglycerophosphate/cardiolipin synthase-like enzyme
MTYRDNEVILSISDNCSMVRGSLKIDSFSVTSGQDPYGQLYSGLLASFSSDGKMSFKVGRQGSDEVAAWFNQRVPASKTTFNHSAGKLNFAFIGTLEITVTGDIFGDSEEIFKFFQVAIAQGHAGASNNWWFGGENCSHTQGDQVICYGTNSKGGLVSLTVRRGGNGVNKIEIKSAQLASISVDALHKYLVTRYGKGYDGSAFALTEDNVLRGGWIAQTPNVWGKEAREVKSCAGIYIADDIKTLISSAEYFIDITTLSPFPDDKFQEKILEGLKEVAESGKEVTVRILAGYPQSSTFEGVKSYLNSFANPISEIANNKLKIYVTAQKSFWSLISWNHAKMVAVDGKAVLLGGQNLWTKDYLGTTPVHDLSVLIHGSAAYYSHQFADILWEDVRQSGDLDQKWKPWSWELGQILDYRKYPDAANFSKPIGEGKVSVLGVGRYGRINANIQPSDYLMVLTFNSAKNIIRIAQQDLGTVVVNGPLGIGNYWWDEGMKAIANAIIRKCDVYIVLSNEHSKGGTNPYSNSTLAQTADKLRSYVKEQSNMTDDELNNLLCEKLHLTTLRFGPSDTWPNGVTFANHSKFFMVDDEVFYVGSSNLYSSNLQEYGVFISDPDAISQMKSEYWDELWEYSRRVAISGSGDNGCYFMKSDKDEL